ncbi:MAG TPA: hypothetical protein VNA65_01480 [Candidatus Dormibacteraeota bacterium]|nr:hypothetical protein [Candidatus Dormibacteraeota bacterium]
MILGAIVWVGFQIADQLGAPGIPSATGSGACTAADAVSIQLTYSDGHGVSACTHDPPACQSRPVAPKFALDNQLRSATRRYILFIGWNVTPSAGTNGQVLHFEPQAFLPKGPPSSTDNVADYATLELTPRDPTEGGWTVGSGTLTLSSNAGEVSGSIDGVFNAGASAPSAVTGRFGCKG